MSQPVRVQAVESRRARSEFIALPWRLYGADPAWVPPLRLERREHLSPKNPYFQHARCRLWLAYRGTRPVGRISAQVDDLHLQRYGDATGFFGMVEAEDDGAVFAALAGAAEGWLREQGIERVRGPFNLSINEECGLLVEGFETPPYIMMGHARPYYGERLETLGYGKAMDLLAYRLKADFPPPAIMASAAKKTAGRLVLRTLRRDRLIEELEILRDIFNDAWSDNWGFVPFTEAEFRDVGQSLVRLVPADFIQILEFDGEAAAMVVLLPNINEAIRDLNGRLLPFGWLKLLWRLKVRFPKTVRVSLMGVRRRYQQSLIGTVLAYQVIDAVRAPALARGVREAEMSWILENNQPMRSVVESLGGTAYKRYRIFEKRLV